MAAIKPPGKGQLEKTRRMYERHLAKKGAADGDPRIDRLVNELIGAIADKWTMLVIEELTEAGSLRFTQLSRKIPAISQKMLTQTLRRMERDGLAKRKVYPVVPPKVEYSITDLGVTLAGAFCGVWVWAEENLSKVDAARARFDRTSDKV